LERGHGGSPSVKTGEVGAPSAAGTRTNGQRRDGLASCELQSEEDGAREGEKGAKWRCARRLLYRRREENGEEGGGRLVVLRKKRKGGKGPGETLCEEAKGGGGPVAGKAHDRWRRVVLGGRRQEIEWSS
jgi:hypothetical protein